jgi:hypothetical protein
MRGLTLAGLLLLAGCQAAGSPPDPARAGSLTIGVGGSVGMAGAAVSQLRSRD